MAFTIVNRKTLYVGGQRVDMLTVQNGTITGNQGGPSRIHNPRNSVTMTPVSASVVAYDMTLTWTAASTFPAVGALVTLTPTANTERALLQVWGV